MIKLHVLRSELLKLKNTPVLLLVLLSGILLTILFALGHLNDVHSLAILNHNPWRRIMDVSIGVYSVFILCPITVLLISAVLLIEQKANAWKYLYALPISRGSIYFTKLLLILFLLFVAMALYYASHVLSGYVMDFIHPEFEFAYYEVDWSTISAKIMHSYIASLGIIGLQYLLSLKFKNFLIPVSIGIFGMIIGFIMAAINHPASLFLPYDYPMIAQDYDMFKSDHRIMLLDGSISNVEVRSLVVFMVCIVLGYFYESRKIVD